MLISSLVGIDMRATMDMDTTIKGLPLKQEILEKIIKKIISITLDDEVVFRVISVKDIREKDEYGGYKVSLEGDFDGIKVPIKIDITTGDTITPREVKHSFSLLFEERKIEVLAYNIETVIAEKLETIITRGVDNTRSRDFYDLYILFKFQKDNIDYKILKEAITNKFKSRETTNSLNNIDDIYIDIKNSEKLENLWNIYRKNYSYAEDISYTQVINNLWNIIRITIN